MHSKLLGRLCKDKSIYLVVAISGRAIAQSLKISGSSVAVIDGFADMDTASASIVCKKVARTKFGLKTNEVLRLVKELKEQYKFDGMFYDAALEFNPGLLESINVEPVIGNTSKTLLRCKQPKELFSVLDKYQILYPDISFKNNSFTAPEWLQKYATSSGGAGVSTRLSKNVNDENIFFQKRLDGVNFSITFIANGDDVKILGFNSTWSESLGETTPYIYSGAINSIDLTQKQQAKAIEYVTLLVGEFNLVGLNSIDFILSDERVYVLEVNPRIPATYDLYENKQGSLIEEHIASCLTKTLSANKENYLLRAHAIVYAPKRMQIPKDFAWPLWTADRPYPEEWIETHQPVCNVFSGGKNVAQVRDMIHTRKQTIISKLTKPLS